MLAKRPWSTYELVAFMERSVLNYILPRTRSQLYNEPKKLARLGLAHARVAGAGRKRTVYSITPEGRAALKAWLAGPGGAQKMEYLSLLKLYLTDCRDTTAVGERLAGMRREVLDTAREALAQIERIENTGVALEDTAPMASLATRLAVHHSKAQLAWLDELESYLADPPSADAAADWAMGHYRHSARQLRALIKRHGDT
nr:helix-turn-helix transcriptional regulator [Parahaliea mediterranea]